MDGTGGPGGTSRFGTLRGIAIDTAGYAYVGDIGNNAVRKIAPDGSTTTLAGNGDIGSTDGTGGRNGTTTFYGPIGLAVDADGTVYVSDYSNNSIRKIDPAGNTKTLAGRFGAFQDGDGCHARFSALVGLAIGPGRILYVADSQNERIRAVTLP
jgi:sugar lactone lactonase YvrE